MWKGQYKEKMLILTIDIVKCGSKAEKEIENNLEE